MWRAQVPRALTGPPSLGLWRDELRCEGPDKPSATPVGLDTQDPEVQLAVLRWMMSKRVGEVRTFAGCWVRLLQIRAGKAILQLVLDEPPDGLYNRWVKERLEYYRRVEPSAPLRDVSVVDQKVPRFRFSRTTQTGHVSDAIWELILRNPEAAALKRIDDMAKGAV